MRILVISNLYPPQYIGGYELICRAVVWNLVSRGHQVEVLTSDYHTSSTETAVVDSGSESGVRVRRLLRIHGMFGNPWLPIWKLQGLERHNNSILRHALKSFSPDLVYCWNFSGISKSMLFTLEQAGVPSAFCLCDHWIARSNQGDVWLKWWNDPRNRPLIRILELCGIRGWCNRVAPTGSPHLLKFRRIHFCSAFLREFTAAAGFQVKHGAVIYCPVDTQLFTGEVKSTNFALQKLLFVGRLHEDKGVMTAIRAMACLKNRIAGRLSVYGSGEPKYEDTLRKIVSTENLPVDFCGNEPLERMPGVYAQHDALIFPSEWPEPFALTPLEAMACGLPVIGTTHGGSAELFRHGQNCLTFSAGDSSELAQRIAELSDNPRLRLEIASKGQSEVRERFSEDRIVDQIEQFLNETVST